LALKRHKDIEPFFKNQEVVGLNLIKKKSPFKLWFFNHLYGKNRFKFQIPNL
jgi:hypothetical protein